MPDPIPPEAPPSIHDANRLAESAYSHPGGIQILFPTYPAAINFRQRLYQARHRLRVRWPSINAPLRNINISIQKLPNSQTKVLITASDTITLPPGAIALDMEGNPIQIYKNHQQESQTDEELNIEIELRILENIPPGRNEKIELLAKSLWALGYRSQKDRSPTYSGPSSILDAQKSLSAYA